MNPKREVHGFLILDKPADISSNKALQLTKHLFKAKKAGHTGSLDPIATGLLPICFGEATKFSRFLLDADKHYLVTAELGARTNTGDSEGSIIEEGVVPKLSEELLNPILANFRGPIFQIPPMYSALKHQGQPLYKLARQGIEIERQERAVTIYHLNLVSWTENTISLAVIASKGTYIRTLVDDLGQALGCGAYVIDLRRVGAGPYNAQQMHSLDTLEEAFEQGGFNALDSYLLPVDSSIKSWPNVKLSESAAFYLRKGQAVIIPHAPTAGWVRLLLKDDSFLGIGEILEDGRVAPRRLTQGSFCPHPAVSF